MTKYSCADRSLVLADAGGVVVIPSAHAETVLATAERIAATEADDQH
jgi:regulator of RNase E activity RraA